MSKKKKPCDWCGDTWLNSITKGELNFCDKFCQEEYESHLSPKVMVDMGKTNWELLKKQKEALLLAIGFGVNIGGYTPDPLLEEAVGGVVNLIDHIQDEASKILGEEVVFGKMTEDQLEAQNEEHMAIIGIINKINQKESKGNKRPVARKRKV